MQDLLGSACLGGQAVKHLFVAHLVKCSYAGAQTIAAAQSSAGREASPGLEDPSLQVSQADGEVLQHLRRLSKRDATTRLKALQVDKDSLSLALLCARNCAPAVATLVTGPATAGAQFSDWLQVVDSVTTGSAASY